eukprot:1774039-Rhodomonas_salina.3
MSKAGSCDLRSRRASTSRVQTEATSSAGLGCCTWASSSSSRPHPPLGRVSCLAGIDEHYIPYLGGIV